MPTPAISLRLKRFRHRFGITAPRVVVRTAYPRHWLLSMVALAAVALFALLWSVREHAANSGQLGELQQRVKEQHEELSLLRGSVGTGKNAVSMERAAQQQLLARIAALESENAALREDMLIFERLIPASGQTAQLRIENFRLTPETSDGRYRYRLLIAFQPAQRGEFFRGRYQITLVYRKSSGENAEMRFPAEQSNIFEVRNFLRQEGSMTLPANSTLLSAHARITRAGKLEAEEQISFNGKS
ncbi:DUF6776 family protein [Azonexus sp.]|uniref:DUF6776 family protein n=1 Tax=Azonexus sp. TaxID=1872668 RepID=UPI0039E6E3F6